jgi:hypothetical protein
MADWTVKTHFLPFTPGNTEEMIVKACKEHRTFMDKSTGLLHGKRDRNEVLDSLKGRPPPSPS